MYQTDNLPSRLEIIVMTFVERTDCLSSVKAHQKFKNKYRTAGKSWYEYHQAVKGKSWKSKSQFDISRMINRSNGWEDFLKHGRFRL